MHTDTLFGRVAAFVIALSFTLAPTSAFAYIDPNAGGALLQILAPLLTAVVAAWVFLRRWLGSIFRRCWDKLWGRPQDD